MTHLIAPAVSTAAIAPQPHAGPTRKADGFAFAAVLDALPEKSIKAGTTSGGRAHDPELHDTPRETTSRRSDGQAKEADIAPSSLEAPPSAPVFVMPLVPATPSPFMTAEAEAKAPSEAQAPAAPLEPGTAEAQKASLPTDARATARIAGAKLLGERTFLAPPVALSTATEAAPPRDAVAPTAPAPAKPGAALTTVAARELAALPSTVVVSDPLGHSAPSAPAVGAAPQGPAVPTPVAAVVAGNPAGLSPAPKVAPAGEAPPSRADVAAASPIATDDPVSVAHPAEAVLAAVPARKPKDGGATSGAWRQAVSNASGGSPRAFAIAGGGFVAPSGSAAKEPLRASSAAGSSQKADPTASEGSRDRGPSWQAAPLALDAGSVASAGLVASQAPGQDAGSAPSPAPTRSAPTASETPAPRVREIDLDLSRGGLDGVSMTMRAAGERMSVVIRAPSPQSTREIEDARAAIVERLASIGQPLASFMIQQTNETTDGHATGSRSTSNGGESGGEAQPRAEDGDPRQRRRGA